MTGNPVAPTTTTTTDAGTAMTIEKETEIETGNTGTEIETGTETGTAIVIDLEKGTVETGLGTKGTIVRPQERMDVTPVTKVTLPAIEVNVPSREVTL